MDVVLATLAIYNGPNNQETIQFLFSDYPTTAEVANEIGEDKWAGLLDSCEVNEVGEYKEEFLKEGSLSFECLDEDDKFVGSILFELRTVAEVATVEVD